jgi:hypothetical protein
MGALTRSHPVIRGTRQTTRPWAQQPVRIINEGETTNMKRLNSDTGSGLGDGSVHWIAFGGGHAVKRLFWRYALAAAGVAVALGGVTAPATADEGTATTTVVDGDQTAAAREDCSPGNFCAWDNYEFRGGPGEWSGNASNYSGWVHTGCGATSLWTWNNCASSVYNHGDDCNLTFYDGINYTGAYYNLPRGSYLARMTLDKMSDGANANDRISSHRWCTF